jgi:hypothetical protein
MDDPPRELQVAWTSQGMKHQQKTECQSFVVKQVYNRFQLDYGLVTAPKQFYYYYW